MISDIILILGLFLAVVRFFDLQPVFDSLARKISDILSTTLRWIFASGRWLSSLMFAGLIYAALLSTISEAVYGYDIIEVLFEGGYSYAEGILQIVLLSVFYAIFYPAFFAFVLMLVLFVTWLSFMPISVLARVLSNSRKGFVATLSFLLVLISFAIKYFEV